MRGFLLTALLLPCVGFAQGWCPPGANWDYLDMSFGYSGYYHRYYAGDTMVLGQQAQRIITQGMRVSDWWLDTTWVNYTGHTSLQDNALMVLAWRPSGVVWDTLLRFDAVPGDRWYLPNYDQFCAGQEPYGMLQVTDTGHVVVDGLTLRRWDTAMLGPNGNLIWGVGPYYERIGFLGGLIPYPFCGVIIEIGESLKCYWDDEIAYISPMQPIGTTCDITLGASSPASAHAISVAPNPGREQIRLTLPASLHRVELIDALGRIRFTRTNVTGNSTIATAHLPSGAYVIRIEGADGSRTGLRWIKE